MINQILELTMTKANDAPALTPFTYMNDIMVSLLRIYFKSHPTYSWNPDEAKTQISIKEMLDQFGNEAYSIPTIIVRRGAASFTNVFNFTNETGGKKLIDFSQNREKNYRAGQVFSVDVFTKTIQETEDIAEEIMALFMFYRDTLINSFQFHVEGHVQKTEPEKLGDARDTDAIRTTLTFVTSYNYTVDYDVLPKYPKAESVDITKEVQSEIEANGKIKVKHIKFFNPSSKIPP